MNSNFAKKNQVEVEVENIDKGGNFLGFMHVEGTNISIALVEQGLAKVHFTADRSVYYNDLLVAQERAKMQKIGVWKDFVEEVKEEKPAVESDDRKTNYKKVPSAFFIKMKQY